MVFLSSSKSDNLKKVCSHLKEVTVKQENGFDKSYKGLVTFSNNMIHKLTKFVNIDDDFKSKKKNLRYNTKFLSIHYSHKPLQRSDPFPLALLKLS